MVTGGIVTILDRELMVTGGIVTIMDSELMVTGGIVTILDSELMVTGGIVTILDSELMVTGGIVTILDSELMVTGGIVTILDSELMVTGGIVTIIDTGLMVTGGIVTILDSELMVTGGIVTILDSELMVTGGIVTILDSELMVTGGIVTIIDTGLMVTGGIVTILDSDLMVTGGIVTILDSELMVTGGIVTILDSELMVTGGIVTIMAGEQCLNDHPHVAWSQGVFLCSVTSRTCLVAGPQGVCLISSSLAGPVLLQDLKRMEDKKTGRLVGSKVSQIANIFQSMVPAKEAAAEVILAVPLRHPQATSPTSPKAERRRTVGGGDELRDSPTQVTVVRTESHVARFNNARALFEKLGSEDNRAASKPPPPVVTPTSKQVPLRSRSSSDNSSAGTSPVRMASRSPSPRPLGGSVSSQPVNGHQANGLSSATDDDSGGGPTPTKTSPTTNVEWLKQTRPSRQQTANVAKPNGVVRGVVDAPPVVRQLPVGLRPKPEKPEKPERKFNSRELIEKQRNWTSHFSKSRSAPRYNSDPNRSEVRVGVVGGKPKQTADTAATRSASFNATRPLRSPAVSPPPPPVRAPSRSPSRSPSSVSEDKLEKEPMEKTCKGVVSSPSRSSDSSSPLSEDRRPQYLSSQENLSRGPSPSSPGGGGGDSLLSSFLYLTEEGGGGVLISQGLSAGSLEVFELAALLNQFRDVFFSLFASL
uniref:Uncharacterized protein n=1 Tax=Timema shepardi TaxID=629360 RepID=A0A7R9AVL5_TIMSH|nr:unnamed protein product [Timema shepardi]